MKKKVVLVHGYNKDRSDMFILKESLEKLGYDVILIDLPLTFKRVEYCASVFEARMEELISNIDKNEKISFVGHSTGGLIIRHFISTTEYKNKIGRCVLIATPNQGSQLADIASNLSDTFINIFKTLSSLPPDNVRKLELKNPDTVEIGAIAGNKSNLILGNFLEEDNDGRVQVNSVKYEGLKDFVVVPYGHKEIHHKFRTAQLVDCFLKYGEFKSKSTCGNNSKFD